MGSKSSKEGGKENNEPEDSNPFIASNRKCTDLLCLILFLVFWMGMLIIAGVGFSSGQPEKLVFGTDWKGRTCGAKANAKNGVPEYDFKDYKNLLYPRLNEDLYDLQMSGASLTNPDNLKKFFGVCVKECPEPTDEDGNDLYAHAFIDYKTNPEPINVRDTDGGKVVENTQAGSPWRIALNTTNVLYRCLDLLEVKTEAFARCIDRCEGEVTTACGKDEVVNPFQECGEKGCDDFIGTTFTKCRAAETREVVDKTGSAKSNPIYDQLNSSWQLVSRWIGDVEKSALPVLICGGLFAIILGFVWLLLLKYCAGFFVWISIILVLLTFAIGTLYLSWRGELIDSDQITSVLDKAGVTNENAANVDTFIDEAGFEKEQDQVKFWAIAAYIFLVMDILIVLLLVFLCSRIKIAVGIIREASKAVQAMPFIIAFPVLPTFCILSLVTYWVIAAAYIASSGDISLETVEGTFNDGESYGLAEYSDKKLNNYMMMYHLFGLLWTNQFLQALGYMTIAGSVAEYYWTLDKSTMRRLPIFRSFYRTMRYHLGSIAFGSLIIALVQVLRLVLEYVDRKTRAAQNGNKFVKAAMLCCKCFLWCFEKCMKFLNINAYIIVAMKGTGFCTSMQDAFKLLLANAARVATVGVISTFLLLLGKLFIVAVSTITMFMFIYNPPDGLPSFFMGDITEVSSPIFPMILTAILSYGVASFFLGVYETAIDTILLCFCEDCKVNKATGTYYMSDELLSFVDGAAKKNAFRHFKDTGSIQDNGV